MGKKPVLGLVGLVWVGIALTGCGESCRNCRNKYSAQPSFQTRNTKNGLESSTPTMIGDAKAPTGSGSTGVQLNDTTGDSGFANLFPVGDWTACVLNTGCMEAATISGMLAAEAITGALKHIIGRRQELALEIGERRGADLYWSTA